MSTKDSPRRTDSNGIPKPVVKWYSASLRRVARCEQCLWRALPADLALCRLHVKTHPDHNVVMHQDTVTRIYAETTDGQSWVEAVNALG